MPGTAWQKAWSRPAGSTTGRSAAAKTTPLVPTLIATTPGAISTDSHAVCGLVAATRHHGSTRTEAGERSSFIGNDAGHVGALERRWQPLHRDVQNTGHFCRPIASGEVEEDRARAPGTIAGVRVGEPESNVVLWQQDVGHTSKHVRFVVAHPQDLGSGESGQGVVARDGDELLLTDTFPNLVTLRLCSLIVPQDRGAKDLPRVVEEHQSMHLAGETNPCHSVPFNSGLCQCVADGDHGGIPPEVWRLLRPERPRRFEVVFRPPDGDNCPLIVHQQRLGSGCR